MADNPFDALDDDGGYLQEAAPPSFAERFQLNFDAAQSQNTVLGAIRDASTESRRSDRNRLDARYEAFPEWQGFGEGLTALAGQIAGTAASPENFLPVGLGEKILVGAKVGVTGLWAKVFAGAVDSAAANAVSDAAIQGIENKAGFRDGFDPVQYGASVLLGAGIGGAAPLAGAIFKGAKSKLGKPGEANATDFNPFDAFDDNPVAPSASADTPVASPAKEPVAPVSPVTAPPPATSMAMKPPVVSETIGETLSAKASEVRGTEPFGPVTQAADIGHDWKQAVKILSDAQDGEIAGILQHPEIGPIDLPWGKVNPKTLEGYGLAHIAAKHPEVVDNLPEIISQMDVVSRSENRVRLETTDHRAGIRLDWNGEQKNWLITAFRKGDFASEKGQGHQPFSDRADSSGDGHPTPTLPDQKLTLPDDGVKVADVSPDDLAHMMAQSRAAKGAVQAADANDKAMGDFLMAGQNKGTPQGGLHQQRTRATAAQTAVGHVARVRETAEALAKGLNVTATREGRISGGRRVLGTYDTRDGVVRVRSLDDFDVLTHEYGHHLDAHVPDVKRFIATHSKVLQSLDYDPMQGRDYEGFAEFFRLWLTNRAYVQKTYPALADEFATMLEKQAPDLAKTIDAATDAWDKFLSAPSTVAVKSTIVSGKKGGWFTDTAKDLKKSGFGGTVAEVLQRMYAFGFDSLHPINRAVAYLQDLHLANKGKVLELNVTANPYKLARMSRGAYGAGHMDVMYGVAPYRGIQPESPSLRDAIIEATAKPNALSQWDDGKVQEFGSYLWSRRAAGEWERYRNGDIPNPPDKLTEADHLQNIKDLEAANPAYASAAAKVHAFARALWKKKFDAGLIDGQTYKDGLLIKDYVPGLRDFGTSDADMKVSGKTGRGGSMKGGLVKRFRGSKRDVINPLESMTADAYETAMAISRNDVVKSLHRLSLTAGVGSGAIAEVIPSSQLRAMMIDPIEAVENAARASGLAKADIVVLRDAVESAVGDEKAAVFRPAMINDKGEPIVFFRDGGKLTALRLADGAFGLDMYRSITGMAQTEKNFWLELVAVPARVLRMGITTAFEFVGANFVRDQVMASVLYGKPLRRIAQSLQGGADDLIGSDVAKNYSRVYGLSGGAEVASLSKAMAEKDLLALRKKGWVGQRLTTPKGLLETVEIAETATRLGLFRTFKDEAKKRGLSDYEALMEASWRARDYLDFDRRGSGMAALARVIPFLNVSLQGTDKMTRHMIAPLAKKMMGQALSAEDQAGLGLAVKSWARLAALTTASVSLYALQSRYEGHDEISETTRSTHWLVKTGGKWTVVPKPFEFGVVLNLGEALFDTMAKKDPAAMGRWVDSLYQTLLPPSLLEGNPAIKSYFEIKSNTDFFTGAPIVPDDLRGMEPWLQYNERTSHLSRQIGEIFDVSPMIADHLITAHLGSWGRSALSLYDLAQPDAPGFAWDDAPIARRFIKDASKGAQSVTMFWNLVNGSEGIFEGKVKSWQALAEGGDMAGAADYYASLDPIEQAYVGMSTQPADVRRLHPLIRARGGIQAISAMRREMASGRMLDDNGDPIILPPPDRTAADDVLSSLAMAMARNGLKETGVAGWQQRELMGEAGFYRELEAINPSLLARLGAGFAEKKVWNGDAVARVWPEVRERILADGSAASVDDLLAEVKMDGLAVDGVKRRKAEKPELVPVN